MLVTMKPQKRNYRYTGLIGLFMIVMLSSVSVTAQTLTFGANSKLVYNVQTGTANVSVQDNIIVSNAYAVVVSGGVTLNSKSYTLRTVTTKDTTDAFGTGKKMKVTLTAAGLPEMQQIFYAYEGKNYLLTEVIVRGANISTNYMAPFVSEQVNIQATGDNRVLFVPFDNDTFIRYQSKSLSSTLTNTSSEVTAYYENNSRAGLIVGSVEHMVWKTGVRITGTNNVLSELTVWGGYAEKNVTRDGIAHGTLSGDSVKSPKVFIGVYDDWRTGLDDYGKANAIAEPRYIFDWTNPVPFGWNSWGAIQDKLNLDKAKAVAQFFSASLPKFRNGETAYIDLDSYWDNMVSGGIEGDFTQLIAFVNYCKERGLKPGIYWAPFVDWGKTSRSVEGTNGAYNYQDVWTKVNGAYHDLDGARSMDPTHPATQKRVELLINKFKACGFEMIKIDFIGHAAIEADDFYDPTVTTGMQAFRKGMEYLVDKLDSKMLVYVAISPSLATGRYAHSRRIACDAYSDIGATEYTLNSTTYGWWQTHIYNFIDADHLVFSNKSLGENRARLASGVINGTLITGDDFATTGQWTDRAKDLLQKEDILTIAKNGVAFTPIEGNAAQSASEAFVNKIGDTYYVAVINYGEQKAMDLSLARLGIPAGDYTIRELFRNMPQALTGSSLKITAPARDAFIFRFTPGTVTSSEPEAGNDTTVLYPNPTNDVVKIRNEKTIRSCRLLASNGDVLLEKKNLKVREYELKLAAYAKGIYFISVVNADGNSRIFKVVKE
jgi:alpha-galactosidase